MYGYAIVSTKMGFDFMDIIDDLLSGSDVYILTEVEVSGYQAAKVTIDNYDSLVYDWYSASRSIKYGCFGVPMIFVDAQVIQLETEIELPAGEYYVWPVAGIATL